MKHCLTRAELNQVHQKSSAKSRISDSPHGTFWSGPAFEREFCCLRQTIKTVPNDSLESLTTPCPTPQNVQRVISRPYSGTISIQLWLKIQIVFQADNFSGPILFCLDWLGKQKRCYFNPRIFLGRQQRRNLVFRSNPSTDQSSHSASLQSDDAPQGTSRLQNCCCLWGEHGARRACQRAPVCCWTWDFA